MPQPLASLLEPYGASPDRIVDLQRPPGPESLPYLDLLKPKGQSVMPDGVVEGRGEALAYILDEQAHPTGFSLQHLSKTLILRGDAPYLVVVQPGSLTVYDTSWSKHPEPVRLDVISRKDERASTTFQRLNLGLLSEKRKRAYLHDLLFKLLTKAIDGLIEAGVDRDDAISLAGRALFMRFLIDRGIITPESLPEICPSAKALVEVFSGRRRATSTCAWLRNTFNGDFLPLRVLEMPGGFANLAEGAFGPLADVMHRSPGGQFLLDWGDLDFAHIPVGLLSQVYERQAEVWDPEGKRQESIYYTPYRIADFMVKEVFAGLRETGAVPPHKARVLDPAVGGGVFLVSAFQEIVSAWWCHNGRHPNTSELREILFQQLVGFEIKESALRLAALSLYLKTIELDFHPRPPEKLRFAPLRGSVLHSVRHQPDDQRYESGSLGQTVGAEHRGAYDVVIGNPPWTAYSSGANKFYLDLIQGLRPLAEEKLGKQRAASFSIPDQVPDLPFVWRATEWAKPGGSIAFTLHARLLFKSSEGGRAARQDLFEGLAVTGILNGADLRSTKVWPGITAPFCLLFALNQRPEPEHTLLFSSPYVEEALNQQGRLRVDSKAAHPIAAARLRKQPELFKSLFRGTVLDVATLGRIQEQGLPTIAQTFAGRNGVGYQVKGGKEDPDFLTDRPNLTAEYSGSILIDPDLLPTFAEESVHRRRRREIYDKPVVVVRKSTPLNRNRGRAFCCLSDLVYNESYYGYSTSGHPDAETMARYLVLLLSSDLFLWYSLLTSGQFGVERDALYKEEVDSFPIRPLKDLPRSAMDEIEPLSRALFSGRPDLWSDLDDWASQVYGLSRWDQEVIRDTLATNLTFPKVRRESQRSPQEGEIETFVARLRHELDPVVRAAGQAFSIQRVDRASKAPWEVLRLESAKPSAVQGQSFEPEALGELFERADDEGASQILLVQPKRRLLLGILRQYRYWTPSRARLCALEIIQHHLAALVGEH